LKSSGGQPSPFLGRTTLEVTGDKFHRSEPSAYWLGAIGIELASGWSLAVEGSIGSIWGQRDASVAKDGILEGQLGLSVMPW
jgi:hypothetical protein